jgi:hypothetical protein
MPLVISGLTAAIEDELRDLIATVRASPLIPFYAVRTEGARERLSPNDQRTQTLHNVRRGNPV